jgi:hypothetical protein
LKATKKECQLTWTVRSTGPAITCKTCIKAKKGCTFANVDWDIKIWLKVNKRPRRGARQATEDTISISSGRSESVTMEPKAATPAKQVKAQKVATRLLVAGGLPSSSGVLALINSGPVVESKFSADLTSLAHWESFIMSRSASIVNLGLARAELEQIRSYEEFSVEEFSRLIKA